VPRLVGNTGTCDGAAVRSAAHLLTCLFLGSTLGCGGSDYPQASRLPPPPWLEPQADQQVASTAPGAQRVADFYRGAAWKHQRDRVDLYVPLDQTNCYWFSGVGAGGVERLHLYLWDQSNDRVATARVDGPMALLAYCPKSSGMYHLQARVARGQGYYVVGTYAKSTVQQDEPGSPAAAPPVASAPAPTTAEPAPSVATDLGAIADQQASSAAPGAKRVAPHYEASTATGPRSEWFIPLDPTSCYWFVGVTSANVKDLSLVLSDPNNKRLIENRSSNSTVVLGHCPKTGGMYHLRAKVDGGEGAYAVGVYSKPSARN